MIKITDELLINQIKHRFTHDHLTFNLEHLGQPPNPLIAISLSLTIDHKVSVMFYLEQENDINVFKNFIRFYFNNGSIMDVSPLFKLYQEVYPLFLEYTQKYFSKMYEVDPSDNNIIYVRKDNPLNLNIHEKELLSKDECQGKTLSSVLDNPFFKGYLDDIQKTQIILKDL